MRHIQQPGPAGPQRIIAHPVITRAVDEELPRGVSLLSALHDLARAHGAEGGCLTLSGGALGPFAYVIPALAPDPSHAAYYSETFRPAGQTRLDIAAITVGFRDGAPFFHCHGFWTEADGRPGGGHMLPEETTIAAPIRAKGVLIAGARFEARQDAETGFKLFTPIATEAPRAATANGIAIRLCPNQDITAALEAAAADAGFGPARLHGGVGSIIGARYANAPPVDNFATEMLIRDGLIRPGATRLDVAMVDLTGHLSAGVLTPGDNPVLMTLEAVLTPA
jgi:predicted DNA-binding protein with PD1-like motif